ncbi:MAG: hypothetical protein II721_01335 [Bacilli bacterium]|nr:hypothetical protein [Bacilli bacterium]
MLACTVGAIALAVGRANHLDAFPVKADPTGYEITFNESNTTVEKVLDKYAIYVTTPRGAKVGVIGWNDDEADFTFKGYSFGNLRLCEHHYMEMVGAYGFDHITGFAISFEGGDVSFDGGDTYYDEIASGHEYTGLSITSDDSPQFIGDSVIITSLTISYSC